MKLWQKIAGVGLALAVIGTAGFLGYHSRQDPQTTQPVAPPTVPVERGDVAFTVTGPGQAVEGGLSVLTAPAGGEVEELLVQPGDPVEAGQTLARLGKRETFEAAVRQAQMDVLEAQQDLDELDPQSLLSEAELAALKAQDTYDQAKRKRAAADYQRGSQASIESAQVDYQQADEALSAAEKIYNNLSWLPEDDPQRVRALSQVAVARRTRDRAKINLNYLTGKPDADEIAQADAELALAQAGLDKAQQDLEQARQGKSPRLLLAQARLEAAQADLREAQDRLDHLEIKAPFAGVVLEVSVRAGQTVGEGVDLITLSNPQALDVEVTVVEEDLPLLAVGQPADLYFDALLDEDVTGHIERIIPERVSGDRAVYLVVISLDRIPEHLVGGMTVDASIKIDERKGVLRLPRTVIRSLGEGKAEVQVWTGSAVEKRTIQVGLRGDSYVEVLSGLQEGEQVVAK